MNDETLRAAIEEALSGGHFFVARSHSWRINRVADEQLPWEVFRGHLLDAAQTRHVANFSAWHLFINDAAAVSPLLSLLWQRETEQIFVVRHILTHGFEAYEDPPGVIHSRPVEKWVRELVGTIDLAEIATSQLASELCTNLFHAVIGTSRLPITSLESPLPAFSLGHFAYFPSFLSRGPGWWLDPVGILWRALGGGLEDVEYAKALETALRAATAHQQGLILRVLDAYAATTHGGAGSVSRIVRRMFQNVDLSPYTDFVERLLALLRGMAECRSIGPETVIDTIGPMLRGLCRHLTAFDLKTFHNFGANYPDAPFLDGLLKEYLRLIENHRHLLVELPGDDAHTARTKRLRRRALRQACLVRKRYEGHPVPDAPTSLGENLRVLPPPYARVPQEQIEQIGKRRKTLFADEPLEQIVGAAGKELLHIALADLDHANELRELGMATFLDRPLGVAKQPGEVDRTPLLSYTAFSRATARQRLGEMARAGWIGSERQEQIVVAVDGLPPDGVPLNSLALVERPGVVSLVDARRTAPDFSILHCNFEALQAIERLYNWDAIGGELENSLEAPTDDRWVSLPMIQHAPEAGSNRPPTLRLYDYRDRWRVELGFSRRPDGSAHFVEHDGIELPERLQVLRIREATAESEELVERDVRERGLWIFRREDATQPTLSRVAT